MLVCFSPKKSNQLSDCFKRFIFNEIIARILCKGFLALNIAKIRRKKAHYSLRLDF